MKKIKIILMIMFLVLIPVLASAGGWSQQTTRNAQGQPFFRVVNHTYNYYFSCYYEDPWGYFTFTVAPNSASMWYPIRSKYRVNCR